ncbi:MAG: aspartate 1-decarboxylase [Phycisphaerae bacterium]|nr:aspartate 1-decarboxylase [Phycisphaerae bacterium]
MLREMLKSKIHGACITDAQLEYEGSIACAASLLAVADILPGEKVLVANLNNGARFETYAIVGEEGRVGLRGAAARLGHPGDRVIIMVFGLMDEEEARTRRPVIVHVDQQNRPQDARG